MRSIGKLNQRVRTLEQKQAGPVKIKLLWYDEVQSPHDPDDVIIKLRWLDEIEKEY
jgi:hypothetical protein